MPDFSLINSNHPVRNGSMVLSPPTRGRFAVGSGGVIYNNSLVPGDVTVLNDRYGFRFDDIDMPIPMSSGDTSTSAANTSGVLVYAAIPGYSHVIDGVTVAYSADPTVGDTNFIIKDGSTTIWSMPINDDLPHPFNFDHPKVGTVGNELRLSMNPAGSGRTSTITVHNHWIR